MRVANALLLLLGMAALLPGSYGQGVRGDTNAASVGADVDEEDSFERLLEGKKPRVKQRCPFPGELERKYDLEDVCEEGEPLYKKWKFCRKYCYVCPCWDEETYFDFGGDVIEDACTPDYCGRKDHELPCKYVYTCSAFALLS